MAENCCGAPPRGAGIPDIERGALIREAFRLEWLTIAWMTIEAIIAIASGIAAHSIRLTAFGIDSLIELASARVLIWRLLVELKHGRAFSEAAERIASRIAGGLLFTLAAYVVAAAGWGLWHREGQAFSWPGLIVTLLAIPVMYLLAKRKLAVAGGLGSRALRAATAKDSQPQVIASAASGGCANCSSSGWPLNRLPQQNSSEVLSFATAPCTGASVAKSDVLVAG